MAQTRKQNVSREATHGEGTSKTCKAVGAITGRRFVKVVTGGTANHPNVSLAGAAEKVYGVAQYDVASGGEVSVWLKGTSCEVTFTAAAVVAGVEIESGATGLARALASGKVAGDLNADVASGAVGIVKLA